MKIKGGKELLLGLWGGCKSTRGGAVEERLERGARWGTAARQEGEETQERHLARNDEKKKGNRLQWRSR